MSNVALTTASSILPKHHLTDEFVVQRAREEDLPEILAIYNQSTAG